MPHQRGSRFQCCLLFLAAALGLLVQAHAETNEFLPELPDLPLWDHSLNVRLAAGYKDNLLLNAGATESSYLLSTTIEAMSLRLPLDGRQLTLFLTAEDIRYPEGEQVKKEQLLLALAQGKMEFSPQVEGGLAVQYIFQDQVFDVSATETNTEPLPLVGHQLALRPSVRWTLPRACWFEAQLAVLRQWLDEPVDDYWEGGPKLTLGRNYGHRSTVSLGCQFALRSYDDRTPLNLDGTAVAGETLDFLRHDFELAWRHNWDLRRHWRTVTRLNFQINDDNGPGYFDYHLYKLTQQIRYVTKTWEFKIQARLSYYDFVSQPVSASDPSRREKTLIAVGARAERSLSKHWKLFADYDYEDSISNRSSDEYRVHKVMAGVDWQF